MVLNCQEEFLPLKASPRKVRDNNDNKNKHDAPRGPPSWGKMAFLAHLEQRAETKEMGGSGKEEGEEKVSPSLHKAGLRCGWVQSRECLGTRPKYVFVETFQVR